MEKSEGLRGCLQGTNCAIIGASGGISRTPHSAIRAGDQIDGEDRICRDSSYPRRAVLYSPCEN